MKTCNNLFNKIVSFENIHLAYNKARKGKRYKQPCQHFELKLEENLLSLQKELKTLTWEPGEAAENRVKRKFKMYKIIPA